MVGTLYNWHLSPSDPFSLAIQDHGGPCLFPMLDFHLSMHVNMLLEGELDSTIGDRRCHFQAETFVLVSPWEIHGNAASGTGFHLCSLTIHPEVLRNSLLAGGEVLVDFLLTEPETRLEFMRRPETVSLCRRLIRELKQEELHPGEYRKARQWPRILYFFTELLELLEKQGLPLSSDRGRIYRKLQPALNRLYSASGIVSLQEAAAACYLSVDYFSHLFKRCFGRSFTAFKLGHRLTLAAADLRESSLSSKEIAGKYGFADKNHFSRSFKNSFGIPPGQFRKQKE